MMNILSHYDCRMAQKHYDWCSPGYKLRANTLHRPHAEHKAGHSNTVRIPGVAFFVVINLKFYIIFNPVSHVSLNTCNYFSGNLEL